MNDYFFAYQELRRCGLTPRQARRHVDGALALAYAGHRA